MTLLCAFSMGAAAVEFVVSSRSGMKLQPGTWTWDSPWNAVDMAVSISANSPQQKVMGFGGAFTEASAIHFKSLSAAKQEEVLELYFGRTGHQYTVGRVPINSCDFSPQSYSFDDAADDFEMAQFDKEVTHDRDNGMIDFVRAASTKAQSIGNNVVVYGSPWSPPSWMKTGNHAMVGSAMPCLKSDPRYHEAWAKYLSEWMTAYEKAGVEVWGLTVQNEPAFYSNNGWEACSYTAAEERDFIKNHLGPQLESDFGEGGKKIMMFDWNKDSLVDWADTILSDAEAAKYVWGVGLHWYSGDFFDQVWYVSHNYDKPVLGTEGCNCDYDLPNYPDDWSRAARYAHDIIGDMTNGVIGWTDWNLLLDVETQSGSGGPNHAGNNCFAQIHVVGGELEITPSYYAYGHFSRYLTPGSVVFPYTASGWGSSNVEGLSARRPDGSWVMILLNNGQSDLQVGIQTSSEAAAAGQVRVTLPAQSVGTVVFPEPTEAFV
mmetsp:Transcript_38158/g.85474  ORF Transcript_38158/g.85474 Transcript_38158/m.85474 type:complete len:488 (+) Transcript_38158:41-1504(+)